MKAILSRRGLIRAGSFILALILVLGIGTFVGFNRALSYKRQLEDTYVRSLRELSSYMTSISTTLNKQIYSNNSAQFADLSTSLWRDAGAAKTALASLPISELALTNTYKFLSQVGNYAMSVSKQNMSTNTFNDEDAENLQSLLDYSRKLNEHINNLIYKIERGEINIDNLEKANDSFLNDGAEEQQSPSGESADEDPGLTSFTEMEDSTVGYPKLIYDGPFSDHLLDRKPAMLENAPEISKEEAAAIAAKITGAGEGVFELIGEENSNMPSYIFESGDLNVSVTKRGGYLVYLINGRQIGDKTINAADTVEIARQYLENLGYTNLKESYFEASNGVCTVNFAYMQSGVICYTDLIKVGVAMDTGEIVMVDSRGYITNHRTRSFEEVAISQSDATAKISGLLTVENVKLALIPSQGMNEVLTYEVRCINQNGDHVMVYINAATGNEQEILLLIETDEGVLTV